MADVGILADTVGAALSWVVWRLGCPFPKRRWRRPAGPDGSTSTTQRVANLLSVAS
jgi:hypothetical protein